MTKGSESMNSSLVICTLIAVLANDVPATSKTVVADLSSDLESNCGCVDEENQTGCSCISRLEPG